MEKTLRSKFPCIQLCSCTAVVRSFWEKHFVCMLQELLLNGWLEITNACSSL